MAMFQLNTAAIAFELALHDPHYEPMVHRFGQDFVHEVAYLPGDSNNRMFGGTRTGEARSGFR
jgi:hypothetical protein